MQNAGMAFHVVQIFLTLDRADGNPQPKGEYEAVRKELLERCGGVTVYARAPAEGLWEDEGRVEADRIVVFEVMDEHFDPDWWASYKAALEMRLDQKEILIRAMATVRI